MVAPLVGVWIEIERKKDMLTIFLVAPLVGVWIEIAVVAANSKFDDGRSPRGSVD